MRKSEFLAECQEFMTEHELTPRPSDRKIFDLCYDMSTVFGNLRVSFEKMDNYGLYSVYMRFTDHDFDYREANIFFSNISSNGKWNVHDNNPEYVLNVAKERLDNLLWIEEEENYNMIKDSETGEVDYLISLKK